MTEYKKTRKKTQSRNVRKVVGALNVWDYYYFFFENCTVDSELNIFSALMKADMDLRVYRGAQLQRNVITC